MDLYCNSHLRNIESHYRNIILITATHIYVQIIELLQTALSF